MAYDKSIVTQAIKAVMSAKRLKAKEVAAASGMSPQQFNDVLNGPQDIRLETLFKVATGIGVEPYALLMPAGSILGQSEIGLSQIMDRFSADELEGILRLKRDWERLQSQLPGTRKKGT